MKKIPYWLGPLALCAIVLYLIATSKTETVSTNIAVNHFAVLFRISNGVALAQQKFTGPAIAQVGTNHVLWSIEAGSYEGIWIGQKHKDPCFVRLKALMPEVTAKLPSNDPDAFKNFRAYLNYKVDTNTWQGLDLAVLNQRLAVLTNITTAAQVQEVATNAVMAALNWSAIDHLEGAFVDLLAILERDTPLDALVFAQHLKPGEDGAEAVKSPMFKDAKAIVAADRVIGYRLEEHRELCNKLSLRFPVEVILRNRGRIDLGAVKALQVVTPFPDIKRIMALSHDGDGMIGISVKGTSP